MNSKDIQTNKIVLPDLKPDSHFVTVPPELALKQIFTLNDPTGFTVHINSRIYKHWLDAFKTESEIIFRLKFIQEFKKTLTDPQEIWLKNKNRAYFRAFMGQRGASYIMAFTIVGNQVNSYFISNSKRQFDKNRTGKLIYRRNKKK